nr:MAG TPA: hypothetical protein [Caudoviricetes sp.]
MTFNDTAKILRKIVISKYFNNFFSIFFHFFAVIYCVVYTKKKRAHYCRHALQLKIPVK